MSPVESSRIAPAHVDTICSRDLVAVKVNVLEDVNVGTVWISFGRWLSRLDDNLHGVGDLGLDFEIEGLGSRANLFSHAYV